METSLLLAFYAKVNMLRNMYSILRKYNSKILLLHESISNNLLYISHSEYFTLNTFNVFS